MKIEPKRCAIYTRKSHDEGLEQDYNSLDAQRDAAMNYIASQRANGWQALPESYDDGGWSGGNINRPALQRMMTDLRAGLIDIVVVYKIDRLSRSLTDFAELQTEFEKYDVSFVSVTQEINTSTSSGRMMLNILMTFAQFEREVIAERIRDKLSASKKKGKYVGGLLPLGYRGDSVNMKMVIEPEEAKIVRLIYDEYLRTSSPKAVQRLLEGKGIRGREWVSKKGLRHGGRPLSIAVIRDILQNPIYIGKLRYHGKVYDGEHEGIIPVRAGFETFCRAHLLRALQRADVRRNRDQAEWSAIPLLHLPRGRETRPSGMSAASRSRRDFGTASAEPDRGAPQNSDHAGEDLRRRTPERARHPAGGRGAGEHRDPLECNVPGGAL